MIILDAEQDQVPKLAVPRPVHPVVRRPSTPTPSLPDYETSQEEEHRKATWRPRKSSKRLKWTIYGLIAYFIVTVAIGIPLIVLKTRSDEKSSKNPSKFYPSPPSSGSSNGSGFNLGEMPVCVTDATVCDAWDIVDKEEEDGMLHSHLEYYIPIANTMFIESNVSYFSSKGGPITGSLDVGVSTNPKDTTASVKVLMSYTGVDVREQTNVCLMNLAGADGLYIYVPENLTSPDRLDVNITMLFPRSNKTSPIYVSNFLTSLPYFSQRIYAVSPRVTFGNVALGGLRSNITIDNMLAEAILIKSPFADVSGSFNGSTSDDDASDADDGCSGCFDLLMSKCFVCANDKTCKPHRNTTYAL